MGGKGQIVLQNCQAKCPNGHWGIIPDANYKIADGILRIHQGLYGTLENLIEILAIGREVEYGLREPDDALDEIVALLPPESAAAVQQFDLKSPLAKIMMIVGMVTVVATAVASIAQAVRSVLPSDPPPQIIINNNNTIINPPAPADGGSCAVPDSSKEGSVGRRKQMEKRRKRLPGSATAAPHMKPNVNFGN
jgi:hypothetical protein